MNQVSAMVGLVWASLWLAGPGLRQERQWHSLPGARWTSLHVPASGHTGFTLLSPDQTGIAFTNELAEFSRAANRVLEAGAGVAAGDYDSDGLPDIFICNLEGPSRLYKNLGHWQFKDVTAEAGIVLPNDVTAHGAVFADINGDGNLDLYVPNIGPTTFGITDAWTCAWPKASWLFPPHSRTAWSF